MSDAPALPVVARVSEDPPRQLSPAERYVLEASSEIAFTRQRREIALSEAEAARAELVGIEYRAIALAHESRRARMPRTLPARAQHGELRQTADGTAGADFTTEKPLVIGEAAAVPTESAPSSRRRALPEMAAPPPPPSPTMAQRFLGWLLGRAPEPPPAPVLSSYPADELPPGLRSRTDQTAYSLEAWGLTPRKKVVATDDAFARRAHRLGGLLREAK